MADASNGQYGYTQFNHVMVPTTNKTPTYDNELASKEYVDSVVVSAASFEGLSDTDCDLSANTTGAIPWLNGSDKLVMDQFIVGTPTATNGNVLVADGTNWNSATPDAAGLVNKSSNQTITGIKTFSGTPGIAMGSSKVQFYDTSVYMYSSADGKLDIDADSEVEVSTANVDIDATASLDVLGGSINITAGSNTTFTLDMADQVTSDTAGVAFSITGQKGNGTEAGGTMGIAAGIGGATGAGGATTISGGAGGATSGTGGALVAQGGAGSAGNANGGAAYLLGGNAHGSGTDGAVNIGTSNTSAVNIGAGVLMSTTNKIQFHDSAIAINASTDGQLDIDADVEVEIATAKLDINCTDDITLDTAATKDIILTSGQVTINTTHNTVNAFSITTNAGGDETLVLTNTQGTAAGAIKLDAIAGGLDINAATHIDIDAGSGNITVNTATGATETASGMIQIVTGAGGVADVAAAGGKAGDIVLVGGDGGAGSATQLGGEGSAIALTAGNGGASGGAGAGANGKIELNSNTIIATTNELQFNDDATKISSSTDGQLDIDADVEVEITTATVDLNGALDVSGTTALGDTATLATDKKLQFRDTGLYINSSADGQLDIDADTELEITAPTVDLNGSLEVSGDAEFSADVDIAYADITRMEYKGFRQVYDFDEGANALSSTVIAKALFTGGGTSGTQAIIAGVGGVMQLDTGATGSQSSTLALTNASMIKTSQNPVFSALVKTDALTHRKILVGLYKDANNYVMFEFDTDNGTTPGNWKLVSNNAGAGEVETDTGVAAAAAYTELSIELAADGSIEAEIGGTDVAETHVGTAADDIYTMYAYIDNKAEAQSNKLDIDYFIIEQER